MEHGNLRKQLLVLQEMFARHYPVGDFIDTMDILLEMEAGGRGDTSPYIQSFLDEIDSLAHIPGNLRLVAQDSKIRPLVTAADKALGFALIEDQDAISEDLQILIELLTLLALADEDGMVEQRGNREDVTEI